MKCSIQGIASNNFETLAQCDSNILLSNDIKLPQFFHIIPDSLEFPFIGILGADFLNKNKCILDFKEKSLKFDYKNTKFTFKLTEINNCSKLILPPRAEKICTLNFESYCDNDYFCPSNEIHPGVFVASSIISIKNEKAPISIVNTTDSHLEIDFPKLIPESLNLFNIFNLSSWSNPIESRLKNLENILNLDHLNSEEKSSILNICRKYNDVFYLSGDKLETANIVSHEIPVIPNTRPIHIKPYTCPHSTKKEINSQIEKLLENNFIEPSCSPWNNPVLIVPKKSSTQDKRWRLVVDFRRLNDVTIGDIFPLPNIVDILDQLGNSTYFSTLDLAEGYYQIALNPSDRNKTAFCTEKGHFQFTRMPQGLKNAPATFQRYMNNILTGLNTVKCFVYLDDVVIHGYDLQDHNKKLCEVLDRFRKFNLKLQPTKCNFLRKELPFLGHIITDKGIKPDPDKISAISNYPVPKSPKDIKSFIGLCGYYRRFIHNFSGIAEPLNRLLRKKVPFIWDAFCDESFHKLKTALINYPILQYPNFQQTFYVTSDASDVAIGAILSQIVNDEDLPIAYASRVLNDAERHYSTVEKELLAIVWSVKRFRPYLFGQSFKIRTDHKPLIFLYNNKNPSSRLVRWRVDMDEYQYEIEYKSGKSNLNADALSRIILPNVHTDPSSSLPQIQALTRLQSKQLNDNNANLNTKIQFSNSTPSNQNLIPPTSSSNIINSTTLNDINLLNNIDSQATQNIRQHRNEIKLPNSNLNKTVLTDENDINVIISEFHISSVGGHQGITRTFNRIRSYYYFPKMLSKIKKFIQKCENCQKNKASRINKCPLNITSTAKSAFEKVFLDIVGPLPASYYENKFILTIQDDLTKYSIAVPLQDQESDTVARAFVEHCVCKFGVPLIIQTDQGSNFMSNLFIKVAKLLKIKKLNSSAYHPESQGALEKSHQNFIEYLRNYSSKDPMQWDSWLPYAIFTFNSTPHTSTSYMPFELVHGFKPNLPSSLKSPIEPCYNYDDYALELKFRLQNSWKIARENLIHRKLKVKESFDKSSNLVNFKIGDKVLLRNETRKKLDPVWEGPYIVTEVNSNVNSTIKIRNKCKIIHNNRLKLFVD